MFSVNIEVSMPSMLLTVIVEYKYVVCQYRGQHTNEGPAVGEFAKGGCGTHALVRWACS